MKVKFKNTTSKKKAVLVQGGHLVIAAGATETVDFEFSDEALAKYKSAGLESTVVGSRQKAEE